VSSEDGLDEMSTAGRTQVVEVAAAADGGAPLFERYTVDATELGLAPARAGDLGGGTPAQNAETTRRILAGEPGPRRDLAALNAGGAIYVSGRVETLEAGLRAAEAALDDGSAAAALDRFVACTRELAAA
jgi:anthranilate phosphoribosyltransferase